MSRKHERAGHTSPSISRAGRSGSAPETISVRWLAAAVSAAVVGAVLCVWGALCFLFWQGSWQLLYHPKTAIAATPSSAGLAFDSIDFATTESGQPQLHGWWIPGPAGSRFTAIYLHGADGDIGDAVPALAPLHAAKLNLLVFDYRGYGRSRFVRPSEAHWREDTEWAIHYLTGTRHVEAASIVLAGSGLGANLAAEVAAVHPELAGVLLEDPAPSPEEKVFDDPRARLVPAHWLVRDRWDLADSAAQLRLPSLWLEDSPPQTPANTAERAAYDRVSARKVRVWLSAGPRRTTDYTVAVGRWLDDLAPSTHTH